MTCAIFARFAASLNRLTFCCGVSFLGAGSANCRVVVRPPGFVCAHTPVAVKRVESPGDFDIAVNSIRKKEKEALEGEGIGFGHGVERSNDASKS